MNPIRITLAITFQFLKQHLHHLVKIAAFCLPVLFIALGCSKENEDNPLGPDTSDNHIWVHFAGDSIQLILSDFVTFDVNGLAKPLTDDNEAIWLSAFVDTQLIPIFYDNQGTGHDSRVLYAYRIEGNDGFSAFIRGYPDNIWEHMSLGYLMTATRLTVFPDELIDLAGAYNVKETRHIRVNRKLDVFTPDTTGFVRLKDMDEVQVNNDEDQLEVAVALKDIVQEVVPDPENYTYDLIALDGYFPPEPVTWTQLQTGYWLLESMKTFFTDPALNTGKYKVRELRSIRVIN